MGTENVIRQWTDGEYTLRLKGFDFSAVSGIFVSLRQNGADLAETGTVTVAADTIQFSLSQEQSGSLRTDAPAELFVGWYEAGRRGGWGPLALKVLPNSPGAPRSSESRQS